MTVKIPSSLKWLVNRHARLLTEIKRSEKQLVIRDELHQQLLWDNRRAEEVSTVNLQCRKAHLNQLKADLKIIDSTLLIHDIPINPEFITPINTQSSVRMFKFGEITRLIFRCLKYANTEYRSTSEITAFVVTHLERNISAEDHTFIRDAVGKRLRKLRAEGKVIVVSQAKTIFDKRWKSSKWTSFSHMGRPKRNIKPSTVQSPYDDLDDIHATNAIDHS
ncbi:MAG: hypothetical protein Q8Q76_01150 [Methylotenera sp.]|nr:hypothetical protein [Methylotenera sp.]